MSAVISDALPEPRCSATISAIAPLARPPRNGSSTCGRPVGQEACLAADNSSARVRNPGKRSARSCRNWMMLAAGIIGLHNSTPHGEAGKAKDYGQRKKFAGTKAVQGGNMQ